MLSQKEINKLIEGVLGKPKEFEVRHHLKVIVSSLSREEAEQYLIMFTAPGDDISYTITSALPDNYCEDLNLALSAAKSIAEKNNQTFVLSLEDGTWKAAYGDWGNCAEYKGANPAYVSCMALLMYMGKV